MTIKKISGKMTHINDVCDSSKWIVPYTEKNSPYYGKDINTLTPEQKAIQESYLENVRKKAKYINLASSEQEAFDEQLQNFRRNAIIKQHNSEREGENITLGYR